MRLKIKKKKFLKFRKTACYKSKCRDKKLLFNKIDQKTLQRVLESVKLLHKIHLVRANTTVLHFLSKFSYYVIISELVKTI